MLGLFLFSCQYSIACSLIVSVVCTIFSSESDLKATDCFCTICLHYIHMCILYWCTIILYTHLSSHHLNAFEEYLYPFVSVRYASTLTHVWGSGELKQSRLWSKLALLTNMTPLFHRTRYLHLHGKRSYEYSQWYLQTDDNGKSKYKVSRQP